METERCTIDGEREREVGLMERERGRTDGDRERWD